MVRPIFIKIVNTLSFFLILGYSLYIGLFKDPEEFLYHDHLTYFTPAFWTFFIWGLIYVLLFGFVIYQFVPSATEVVADGIGLHFFAINIWYALSLLSYETNHTVIAIIPTLILSGQITYVYSIIKFKYPAQNWCETLWIHVPFSLYHGWVFALTILSLFIAFSQKKVEGESPSILTKVFIFLGLFFLGTTAIGYIERGKGDIVGAFIIAWFIYGIAVEQEDTFIRWSAVAFAVITTFYILKPACMKYIFKKSKKDAPLLG